MTSDDDADIGGTGYGIDDLADYLDRGRIPRDPVVESNPECLAALDRLDRVRRFGRELAAEDVVVAPPVDERWIGQVLSGIGREVRAGRDVPLETAGPDRYAITEGALRGLVRRAVDAVPGVILGRCRFVFASEFLVPEAPVAVDLSISVVPRAALTVVAQSVREAVAATITEHTRLVVERVDVTVVALHEDES